MEIGRRCKQEILHQLARRVQMMSAPPSLDIGMHRRRLKLVSFHRASKSPVHEAEVCAN
jgi:hypothetical protein